MPAPVAITGLRSRAPSRQFRQPLLRPPGCACCARRRASLDDSFKLASAKVIWSKPPAFVSARQDKERCAPYVSRGHNVPDFRHHPSSKIRRLLLLSKIKSARSRSVGFLAQRRSSCSFPLELKITLAGPSRGPTAHARVALYRAASKAARPSPDEAGLGPCGSRSLPRSLAARPPETTSHLDGSKSAPTSRMRWRSPKRGPPRARHRAPLHQP